MRSPATTDQVRFGSKDPFTVGAAFRFVRLGMQNTFRAIPHNEVLGVAALRPARGRVSCSPWRARRESAQVGQMAAPIALLVGSVLFLTFAAAGRATLRADLRRRLALRVAHDCDGASRARGRVRCGGPAVATARARLPSCSSSSAAPFSLRGVSRRAGTVEEALREHEAHDAQPAPFSASRRRCPEISGPSSTRRTK